MLNKHHQSISVLTKSPAAKFVSKQVQSPVCGKKNELIIKSIEKKKNSSSSSFVSPSLNRTPTPTNSTETSRVKKPINFVLRKKSCESFLMKKLVSVEKEIKSLLEEVKKTMQAVEEFVKEELPKYIKGIMSQIQLQVTEKMLKLVQKTEATRETKKEIVLASEPLKEENAHMEEIVQDYIESIKMITSKIIDRSDYPKFGQNGQKTIGKMQISPKIKTSMSLDDKLS